MKISVQNITKRFGAHTVLGGVNLEAGSEIFGLLGPSGAGKTTLYAYSQGSSRPTAAERR